MDAVVPRELRFGVSSGVDQIRSNVRQILRYGADFIKVIATGAVLTSGTDPGLPEFTEDELRAAVEEAALAGTHVACHAHGAEGSSVRSAPVPDPSNTVRSSTTRRSS